MPQNTPAILVLADGTVFRGLSIGASGVTVGEVVFNTAMTGYQEILTDPSYTEQIVTLTYPHIGNYGINVEDVESSRVYAAGLVIRDLPLLVSNWRANQSLSDYLQSSNVVAIADIDTRKLTRILREKGAQAGCIMAGEVDEAKALELARGFPGLAGMDLAKVVSATESYEYEEGEWALGEGYKKQTEAKYHVVASARSTIETAGTVPSHTQPSTSGTKTTESTHVFGWKRRTTRPARARSRPCAVR